MLKLIDHLADKTSKYSGHAYVILASFLIVILWASSGPVFKFSETWQLVINTGTTIVTFLMVFLIQNEQNRSGAATLAKLDWIIANMPGGNEFLGIEKKNLSEIEEMAAHVEE